MKNRIFLIFFYVLLHATHLTAQELIYSDRVDIFSDQATLIDDSQSGEVHEPVQTNYVLQEKEFTSGNGRIDWTRIPGMEVSNNANFNSQNQFNLRASNQEQVELFWNQLPLSGGLALGFNLGLLSNALANSLTINHGQAPPWLGGVSGAGQLQFKLRPNKGPAGNRLQVSADQWGERQAMLQHQAKKTPLILRASILERQSNRPYLNDQGTPLISNDDSVDVREHSRRRQYAIAGSLPSFFRRQQFSFFSTTTEQDIQGISNSNLAQASSLSRIHSANLEQQIAMDHQAPLFFSLNAMQSKQRFADPLAEWGDKGTWNTEVMQGGATIHREMSYKRWLWHWGAHFRQVELKQFENKEGLPLSLDVKASRQTPDVALRTQYFFASPWILEAGGRVYFNSDRDKLSALQKNSEGVETQLGARWNMNSNHALRIGGSRTTRFPSLQDYFGAPGLNRANRTLVEEDMLLYELGHEWIRRESNSQIVLFHKEVDHPLAWRSDITGLRERINWHHASINGVEIKNNWETKLGWSLDLNYIYQEPLAAESLESPYQEMPDRFRHMGSMRLGYRMDQWLGSVQYAAKRQGVMDTRGAMLRQNIEQVDFLLEWSPNSSWLEQLALRINNIFDDQTIIDSNEGREPRLISLSSIIHF